MRGLASILLLSIIGCHVDAGEVVPIDERACTDDDALAVFRDRIAPLMSDDRVSTCNECHLSGIDLGLYAQDDPCATMACMVDQGVVDLESPDDSLVLAWIDRASPASELITADVIKAEHDAMRDWIRYSSRCGETVCPPIENPCGNTVAEPCEVPPSAASEGRKMFADPGDCREVTLEAGFDALVFGWRGRCFPCHFDSHPDETPEAPKWVHDGACGIGAVESMHNLLALGDIDVEHPEESFLLLKPLAESAGGVEHGGGDKFHDATDPAYQDFVAWLQRWAACHRQPDGG